MTLKISSGKFKGRILKSPTTQATRPTQAIVRAAVFNMCQNDIEGSNFLDLFAGSGAMGLEAISRGAAKSVLVEQNKQALLAIKENIKLLDVAPSVSVLAMDVVKALIFLKKSGNKFHIIYIDPPYDMAINPLLDQIVEVMEKGAILLIEERYPPTISRPMHDDLEFIDSRKFGIALLTRLIKK